MKALVIFLASVGLLVMVWGGQNNVSKPFKPKLDLAIKPRDVADALRAVILANLEVYDQVVVTRQSEGTSSNYAANSRGDVKRLPSGCEMLRLSSQAVASKGVDYSFLLRSLSPLNPRNRPETEVETKGLQFLTTRPDLTYAEEELLGGRWYFTAVYPQVASSQRCFECHNRAALSSDQALKTGQTIGALVVRIALEL